MTCPFFYTKEELAEDIRKRKRGEKTYKADAFFGGFVCGAFFPILIPLYFSHRFWKTISPESKLTLKRFFTLMFTRIPIREQKEKDREKRIAQLEKELGLDSPPPNEFQMQMNATKIAWEKELAELTADMKKADARERLICETGRWTDFSSENKAVVYLPRQE